MPRSTPQAFKHYSKADLTLDRADFNRRGDAIESLFASMPADGIVTSDGIITRKALAKLVERLTVEITSEQAVAIYGAKLLVPDGGGLYKDDPDARTFETIHEKNETPGVPIGTIVTISLRERVGNIDHWEFDDGFAEGVNLTRDTMGSDDETEAAATDDYDMATQGVNNGVTITQCTRIAYDHSAGEILYAYYRDWTFDGNGHLLSVGTETRVIIDAPDDC